MVRGQDAVLRLVVCADPRPRRAAWEWGSLQLEAGDDLGRYKADELSQVCYFILIIPQIVTIQNYKCVQ